MGLFTKSRAGLATRPPPSHPLPTSPHSPFRNLGTAMTHPYALRHYPPHVVATCREQATQCLRELAGMKKVPVINPNMPMAEKWLGLLHRLLEPLVVVNGQAHGMRQWMIEVQLFTQHMRERIWHKGIPLSARERQAMQQYGSFWIGSKGGATDLSPPQAQIVIATMLEVAQV